MGALLSLLSRHPGAGRDLRLQRRILAGIPAFAGMTILLGVLGGPLLASEGEKAVTRDYSLVRAPPAPRTQEWDAAETKSAGCVSCHIDSEAKTMHRSQAVVLGCTDCHGGNAGVRGDPALAHDDPAYVSARDRAHVLNTSASSTRPTIASRATAAAPAISRRSRRPSAP
jgi:hypothetical protein